MWELICHHTYKLGGLPVDLSKYDSHGKSEDVGFVADGVAPKSGAVEFPRATSRVRVAAGAAWEPLVGIKVEVVARRNPLHTHVQTLITGHQSFSFFITNSYLHATFRGASTMPLQNSDGVNGATDAVVPPQPLPVGPWQTLGFTHDGLDTMELTVDGQVVARRQGLLGSVPLVGPQGVVIGNGIGDEPAPNDCYLNGDIDEIQVWRLDPDEMRRNFLARPIDPVTADCWKAIFQAIRGALEKHPDCAREIAEQLPAMLERMRRAIVAKGPETRERYLKTCAEYQELWRAGRLDSPQMEALLKDWCAWMRLVGIAPGEDREIQAFMESPCMKLIRAECGGLDLGCDPQAAAFVGFLVNGCGGAASAAKA